MPFAKVGAMPQPSTTTTNSSSSSSKAIGSSSSKKNGKSGSSGSKQQRRPKGITMEDLKKQTARRLAQEQNQVQGNGDLSQVVIGSHHDVVGMTTQQAQHVTHQGQLYPRNSISKEAYFHDEYPSNPYPPSSMIMTTRNTPHTAVSSPMRYSSDSTSPMPLEQLYPPPSLVQQQQHSTGYTALSSYANFANAGDVHSHDNSLHVAADFPQGYSGLTQTPSLQGSCMGVEQVHSPVPPSFTSTNMVTKNKLPHGLTVHELKEMTKARLQAEAAEKLDGELQSRDRGVSPLDFDVSSTGGGGSAQPRERAMSRDSAGRSNSVFYQKPMVGSDIPHSVEGFTRTIGHSPTLRQVHRSDTWDSASVASYNSNAFSENFGSELALDVSFDRGSNRARSFTVPSLPSADGIMNISSWPVATTPGQAARGMMIGTPVFDAAVGGNRRRAVTLSPGTGSILEDQPHHGTWTGERLQLPTFGGPSGNSSTSVNPVRQRVYSPVLEQLGLDGPFARSHSEDSTLGTNLFGGNLSDFHSTSLSSSEFTRESSIAESRIPAPPPGFSDNNNNSDGRTVIDHDRLTTFSPHEPVRDSFLESGKNPWGGGGGLADARLRLNTVDNLTSDLGSILNLSGSERLDRNRANTYAYGSDLPITLPSNGRSNDESNGMRSFQY